MKNLSQKNSDLLIVFLKNPVVGEVKTRLAGSIGDFNAFKIYIDLLFHTHMNVKDLSCDKAVFYSDYIDTSDLWENDIFFKSRQFGESLGERMQNAFQFSLISGYENVILIGSDIIKLKEDLLTEAFEKLSDNDIVIGPAVDGGYYLIGMKKMHAGLFKDIRWGGPDVYNQTIYKCDKYELSYGVTRKLADLDTVDDFKYLDPADRFRFMQMIKQDNYKYGVRRSVDFDMH